MEKLRCSCTAECKEKLHRSQSSIGVIHVHSYRSKICPVCVALRYCQHTTKKHTHTQSWALGWVQGLRAGSRGSQMTSMNAHMNVFAALSSLTTFLSPLYLSSHPVPTCLAHSTPPFPLSLSFHPSPSSLRLTRAANCSATPLAKEQAVILHTALQTPPAGSYSFGASLLEGIRKESRETGGHRQTDRNGKMYSLKNTKPQKHNSNARDKKKKCVHTTIIVYL